MLVEFDLVFKRNLTVGTHRLAAAEYLYGSRLLLRGVMLDFCHQHIHKGCITVGLIEKQVGNNDLAVLLDIAEDEDLENIVLDCTDLEYIASSGLRLFFAIAKNARTREARVVIKNPCDFVRQTLHMTGLSSMFEYE